MKHHLTYVIHLFSKLYAVNIAPLAAIQVKKHTFFGALGIQMDKCEKFGSTSPRAYDNITLLKTWCMQIVDAPM